MCKIKLAYLCGGPWKDDDELQEFIEREFQKPKPSRATIPLVIDPPAKRPSLYILESECIIQDPMKCDFSWFVEDKGQHYIVCIMKGKVRRCPFSCEQWGNIFAKKQ